MQNRGAETTPNVYARIIGILFIIMTIASIFSMMYVPALLKVPGDATATANNVKNSEVIFRLGIIGHMIILFSDLGVSILLYILLKPVDKALSLIAAAFRLVMTATRSLNLLNYIFILLLLSGADYLSVFKEDQLNSLVLFFFNAFDRGVFIDLAFFSFHLLIVGYLVFTSRFLPRFVGILVMIAGIGYLSDSVTHILFPDFKVKIAMFTFIGELVLAFWLLIKGVNISKWHAQDTALS